MLSRGLRRSGSLSGKPQRGSVGCWGVALGLGSAGRHHVSAAEQGPCEGQNPSSWAKPCCGVPVACTLTGGNEDFNPSHGLYVYREPNSQKNSSSFLILNFLLIKVYDYCNSLMWKPEMWLCCQGMGGLMTHADCMLGICCLEDCKYLPSTWMFWS